MRYFPAQDVCGSRVPHDSPKSKLVHMGLGGELVMPGRTYHLGWPTIITDTLERAHEFFCRTRLRMIGRPRSRTLPRDLPMPHPPHGVRGRHTEFGSTRIPRRHGRRESRPRSRHPRFVAIIVLESRGINLLGKERRL